MSRASFICCSLAFIACLLAPPSSLRAEKSAGDLVPKSVAVYVEMNHPTDLMNLILDHPLRKTVEQSDAYRQAIEADGYQKFMAVLGVVEERAGLKWRPAIEAMTGAGIVLAFDPASNGVILLARPKDAAIADKVRDTVFALSRADAQNNGKPDPIETKTYRGLTAYTAGEATIANLGPWLMVSNKPDLAKMVADLFLDGGAALNGDHDFADAHQHAAAGSPPTAWAFIRLDLLRKGGPPLFDPTIKSDNPVLEFLIGGLIPALQKAPYFTLSAWVDSHAIKLSAAVPNDPSWTPAARKFFFAAAGDGAAKPLLPKDTLLSITAYRDFPAMWRSSPDLFNEAVATNMAQVDGTLSTFFGGKSFSADVLGAIEPRVQFVVAKQDYKVAGVHKPEIRLPGMALVLSVKEEMFAKIKRNFRVGFQSVIAFVNIDGGQKGRPLLEIATETRGGAEIIYATYGAIDEDTAKKPPTGDKTAPAVRDDSYLNFSPAIVMSKNHMILCSTRQIAEELADLIAAPQADATVPQNIAIHLNAAPIAALIRENRDQLVARNMLDKGHDRAAAEKEIGLLETIVRAVGEANVSLTPTEKSMTLDVELMLSKN